MFGGAKLCWEANGPGREFGVRVKELGYGNIYYRTDLDTGRQKDFAGWWSGKEEKRLLLSSYRQALADGQFINRSNKALDECKEYLVDSSGSIDHMPSKYTEDPTKARDNHGDRVIADACCWWVMKHAVDTGGTDEKEVPPNCVYARVREFLEPRKIDEYDW